ncbi:MAG: RHS repeat-associated core domain-containing protein [Gammaproteobacteria bacterium]|nr:MAG: RHS repeat-associated core domain-containing protein [Gammaproteobacteria bacterium]
MLEKVTRGGVTEYKHLIPAGSSALALHTRRTNATNSTYYVTRDQLGSATAVMAAAGNRVANWSFSAFGSRRRSTWQDTLLPEEYAPITATTRRGFTGHEHLDSLSLVHMNGRVYDPKIGRFMSADLLLGDPGNPQSLNPYSYVGNNPLSLTDPTGFEAWSLAPDAAIADMDQAIAHWQSDFSAWRSTCLSASALCDTGGMPSAVGIRDAALAVVSAATGQMWADTGSQLRSDLITGSFDKCTSGGGCQIVEKGAYNTNQHRVAVFEAEFADFLTTFLSDHGAFVIGDLAQVRAFWAANGVYKAPVGNLEPGEFGGLLMADAAVDAGRHAGIAASLEIAGGTMIGASNFLPGAARIVVGVTGIAILSGAAVYHYYYAREHFEYSLDKHIGHIEKAWDGNGR